MICIKIRFHKLFSSIHRKVKMSDGVELHLCENNKLFRFESIPISFLNLIPDAINIIFYTEFILCPSLNLFLSYSSPSPPLPVFLFVEVSTETMMFSLFTVARRNSWRIMFVPENWLLNAWLAAVQLLLAWMAEQELSCGWSALPPRRWC